MTKAELRRRRRLSYAQKRLPSYSWQIGKPKQSVLFDNRKEQKAPA